MRNNKLASAVSLTGDIDFGEEEVVPSEAERQELEPNCSEFVPYTFHYFNEERSQRVNPGFPLMHHESRFRKFWDAITCVALIYMSITLPVFVALDINTEWSIFLDNIIDAMFIVDLFLNFVTTIADSSKILITDPKIIACEYLSSWFPVDLVSSIPIKWMGLEEAVPREAFRMVKLLKLLKLMRVFRLGRLVGKAQERYQIKHATVMIAKFAFIILFAAHWLGCIYFFIARIQPNAWIATNPGEGEKTWLTEYLSDVGPPVGERSKLEQYITCLYWALTTMTTIGYGDIIPKTAIERVLTIICMIVGAFTFAYGLTNVCTLLFNHNKYQVEFECLTDEITEFLDRHQIPSTVQQKVQAFLWFRHNSSTVEDNAFQLEKLLEQLSPGLRDNISLHLEEDCFRNLIHHAKSPLLYHQMIRVEMAYSMQGNVYPPDELIRGDVLRDARSKMCDRVFFITKGVVNFQRRLEDSIDITGRQHAQFTEPVELICGSSFGEKNCLPGLKSEWEVDAQFKALQHTDVYSVSSERVAEIFSEANCHVLPWINTELRILQDLFRDRPEDYVKANEVAELITKYLALRASHESELQLGDLEDLEEGEEFVIDQQPQGIHSKERVEAAGITVGVLEGCEGDITGSQSEEPQGAGGSGGATVEELTTEIIATQGRLLREQDRLLQLKDALAVAVEKRQRGQPVHKSA